MKILNNNGENIQKLFLESCNINFEKYIEDYFEDIFTIEKAIKSIVMYCKI